MIFETTEIMGSVDNAFQIDIPNSTPRHHHRRSIPVGIPIICNHNRTINAGNSPASKPIRQSPLLMPATQLSAAFNLQSEHSPDADVGLFTSARVQPVWRAGFGDADW
ncbi:hypothetical protein M0R45_016639 [Rubus argutus]|uniref:Uncharacterized protein n=1 Tax=Rubus argutus TaxID=59490 RepID=A0AAW1XVM9_RUBAR